MNIESCNLYEELAFRKFFIFRKFFMVVVATA